MDQEEDPVGICFACEVKVVVHDFGPETDSWDLHEERSPKCPYIALGKKKYPSEYKFGEIYQIFIRKELWKEVGA